MCFVLGSSIVAGVVCEAVYHTTKSSNRTRFVEVMLKTMIEYFKIKITQIFDQIYHLYLRGRYKSRLLHIKIYKIVKIFW